MRSAPVSGGRETPLNMRVLQLKIPPVALTLICGLLMWGLSAAVPAATFPFPGALTVAVVVVFIGGVIAISGVFAFLRHSTTTNPMTPDAAESIVTDGIYRFTRNPMYVGLTLALVGWAVFLANAAALLVPPLFVAWLTHFQIKPEERALVEKFGRTYADYMADVRRWV